MPATKYLCIDDQQGSVIEPLLQRLATDALSIHRQAPVELSQQIRAIEQFIADAGSNPVGLLLDLRLDMDTDAQGVRVAYRGPSLAQELRTRMTERAIPAVPLVLWSVNTKFMQSFTGDETAHDLFDAVYGKDGRVQTDPQDVSREMVSLADGYLQIKNRLPVEGALSLIGFGETDPSAVYRRFIAEYEYISGQRNVHDVARFILEYLIKRDGLVVGEFTLAARLGVDVSLSDQSWVHIRDDVLGGAEYSGPFSDGWRRWWWFRVEDWWASISEGRSDLRKLTAVERTDRINSILGANLVAAEPILPTYSTKYFALCAGTNRAIDPADGLRVLSLAAKEWHDTQYVSTHAALERINKGNWRLDPLDYDRLDALKGLASDGEEAHS